MNLKRRGIGENDFCPCCGREVESIFHSIIHCEVAKRVWDCWDIHFVEIGRKCMMFLMLHRKSLITEQSEILKCFLE